LQRQLNEGENYDTYYVYDDYGNLRYVLPPLCVDAANLTEGIEKYGYVYKYDHRNRCIEKKLPGAQAIHYVYDKANRLILSQDGVQRASNEWTFHKYDRLGRLILSGTKTIAQNRASLANTYANLLIVETRGNAGSLVYRYTNTSTLSVTGQEVKLVNYYDNYIPGVLSPNSLGAPCGQSFSSSQGLLTGTISKVYNTTPVKEISTNYYYTYRGELSAEYSSNMANGSDYEFYEYNMPYGELNRKCLRHYGGDDDGLLLPENYEYHYDHAGRMTQKFYSTNEEESPVLMASYEYNPLGQLKSKNTGGVETTTYQYNIRGWLTHLSGQRFSEILSYEGLFGGNIASVTWSIPFLNNQVIHRYDYTYDDLNRMTQALYTGGGSRNYASTFTYDKHGNPLTITRNGRTSTGSNYTFGLIDHLSMNYNGNRLINVDESINNQLSNDLMEFKKKTGNEQGYTYNANGNLTKDLYKKISNIQYNSLNLPNRININGSVTYYCYDAAGVKCQEIHETSTSPYSSTTTVYGGNVIYENGELSKAITEEGFYNVGGDLYYYLRDHLGNNRVAVNSQYDQVSETNNYYPYGMSFAELMLYAPVDVSRYKYNGKELDKMYGLNLYDYGTRMYDPAIGRFTTMDPMAEKYYSVSPYAYCLNNPVKYVDPDGRKIKIANNYAGAMENVAKIAATSLGSQVMNHLIGRDETYTLNSTFWSTSSSYDPSSLDINYVGDPWYNEIPYDGGALNSMVAMGHETFHAFDHSNNVFNSANAGYSKDIAEPRAVSFGNYLRSSYSLSPLREKYGSIQGNFHQFSGSDKISDFTTLGNNADKTSYGFSYTKTTTKVESHKTIAGIKIPDKKSTTSTTYYMTVSRDKNNNASLQIYNNEDEYKKATSNW
jgi:RHS repeat-associated protein